MKTYLPLRFLMVSCLLLSSMAFSEEEEVSRFGPKKGVTEADEHTGFRLNPSAVNNFKIKTQALTASKTWTIPRAAIAFSKEETHVFTLKDGFFKSEDVVILQRDAQKVLIQSKDLKSGDLIVVQGTAFLTIVNEAVFGEEIAHEH